MDSIKELWEIYVPTIAADGQDIPLPHHYAWDAQVRQITGGLTLLHTVKGQWRNASDACVHEQMIPVRIMATQDEMLQIAQMTGQHYQQTAIFMFRVSQTAMIVNI